MEINQFGIFNKGVSITITVPMYPSVRNIILIHLAFSDSAGRRGLDASILIIVDASQPPELLNIVI